MQHSVNRTLILSFLNSQMHAISEIITLSQTLLTSVFLQICPSFFLLFLANQASHTSRQMLTVITSDPSVKEEKNFKSNKEDHCIIKFAIFWS